MADKDHREGEIPQRPLGRTGVKVSALGVGGHHLGDVKTVDEAIRLVHEAVDAGITFFDNCWEYWNGRAEDWLGRGLEGPARQGLPHDQGLHPRPRRRPGDEDARGIAAPAADRPPRPVADPRRRLRQRPRAGLRQGRRPRGARQGQEAGQDALRRLHRPQGPEHSPGHDPPRLSVRHGADAAQLPGRDLPQLREAGPARGQQARHRGAGHEADGRHGRRRQERPGQGGGDAALRHEPAGRRPPSPAWTRSTCCARTCGSRAASSR